MQCHGWSTAIRSFRFPAFRNTFMPKPARNASRSTFPTWQVAQSCPFGSAALANASEQVSIHKVVETSSKLSPAALARAGSQTIRMCAKEKQFGDALYILNSMRFSVYPPGSNLPPSKRAASVWLPKPEPPQLLSSTLSSIGGYTFINFGQPVPTRLASHSFLHSLVKAGLSTKAAEQAKLMMADGIRIHTKTMESILVSTLDQSPYPPIRPKGVPVGETRLNLLKYPVADAHTRIAVRLLEQARRRRQERTHRMYDVVINACLIQGEIIVASLLFIIVIKDWQLREAIRTQRANDPPQESPEPLTATPLYPTRRIRRSLLERIDHALTTRKDPQDPLFQNAIQALANLAFAVDTGQFPSRFMGSLIKSLYSVPKLHAVVYVGSPPEVRAENAHRYIHKVLMKLVGDAGGKPEEKRDMAAGRKFNVRAFNTLIHYCLRHRRSKTHASDLLEAMEKKWQGTTVPFDSLLLRGSTLLRDDTVRPNIRRFANASDSAPIPILHTHRTELPLTRWAHIVDVLKLELTPRYPSEFMLHTTAAADPYIVTGLISHLTATGRWHLIVEKLTEIIPELKPIAEDGSRVSIEERGRRAAQYGPYFFTTVLNALVKGGRTGWVERVWRLAIEAEKASWVDGNDPWFLPIHAYTCMVQSASKEGRVGKVAASLRRKGNRGAMGRRRRRPALGIASAETTGRQVFRAVQARCQLLETAKERDRVLSGVPPALRKFAPDKRYFNALLDLYGRRILGYARPMKSRWSYWRWLEEVTSRRFVRSGVTTVHWHPMLAEVFAEMRKYGYEVPEGFRFLLVGRTPRANVNIGETKPARRNLHRLPILKTRGLPCRRVRRGV